MTNAIVRTGQTARFRLGELDCAAPAGAGLYPDEGVVAFGLVRAGRMRAAAFVVKHLRDPAPGRRLLLGDSDRQSVADHGRAECALRRQRDSQACAGSRTKGVGLIGSAAASSLHDRWPRV